jgi:lipopolysaccharide/colanic/teichoic acid biosynthesis glycosyltransferase
MLTKRIFDFVGAAAGILVLAPSFAVIALLIKLDSAGPVFFRQQRVGRHGSIFDIVKFRTMAVTTEAQRLITVGNDARITRIGYVLRRYKIDELPQLLNVLRGEMSLVGPRPEVPRYVACYPENLRAVVLSVLPGITDWASLEFRQESDLLSRSEDPERTYVEHILPIKLDYYVRYVCERNFLMDLKIIFLTLLLVAGHSRKGPMAKPDNALE